MSTVADKLSELRNTLETLAFLVTQEGTAREAHAEIVKSLVLLSEIETGYPDSKEPIASAEAVSAEVNKVGRRLRLWAKRPDQINSKILTAFLRLKRAGAESVTESDLRNKLPEETSFDSNFAQMKIIAERNHGKIFEQYGDTITLWKPIIPAVRKFEKSIFQDT